MLAEDLPPEPAEAPVQIPPVSQSPPNTSQANTSPANPSPEADIVAAVTLEDSAAIASILESLPQAQRLDTWRSIPEHLRLDVLIELREEAKALLIKALDDAELVTLFEGIEAEDLLELDEALTEGLLDQALAKMDSRQRSFYDAAQRYTEDQIGHWLDHQLLIVPQTAKPRESMRILRREVPAYSEVVYLVNRVGQWKGCVEIADLPHAPEHLTVSDFRLDDYPALDAAMAIPEACKKVMNSGYSALPVVDENGVLLGRVTLKMAAELLLEDVESRAMSAGGLDEGADLFAPVFRSAKTRALWLGINLLTALLASWFIGLFQTTLEKVVVLAVLMPVVASMGGIAGSQTLTLIIRGLALGQVNPGNRWALLRKELSVGSVNGILWAVIIGVVSTLWFGDWMLGVVIACAIVANIICAALSGVGIPILLKKLNIDPALSGSVILTTVTDIVGFVMFLGLGALLLT